MSETRKMWPCGCTQEREPERMGLACISPCRVHREHPMVFSALLELSQALTAAHRVVDPVKAAERLGLR